MTSNPVIQWVIFAILWLILSFPIYLITNKKHLPQKSQKIERVQIKQDILCWLTIKASPKLNSIIIKQGNKILLDSKNSNTYELEKEIIFDKEDQYISFHVKAIFKEKNVCMSEIIISIDGEEDFKKTIWGKDGLIDGIMEFEIK